MQKRVLTLDDLVSFWKSGGLTKFSSAESGFKLSVQAPATFSIDQPDANENDNKDDSMFYGTIKAFHTEENRNGSYVPVEAAVKAMGSLAYRPILAYINCFDEETEDYDFTSHQIDIDEKGNYIYIESQVGCFTADQPYMKYDEDFGKTFIYGRCAIPRTYTRAAEIIEKKGGTKVSVELSINSMSWNSEDNVLVLEDFIVEGCTLLGRSIDNDYGAQVEEGMQGAKLILDDFKEDNNSIVKYSKEKDKDTKLIETLEKLNTTLSNLSIDNTARKEEALMDYENKVEDTVLNEAEQNDQVQMNENTENDATATEPETVVENEPVAEENTQEFDDTQENTAENDQTEDNNENDPAIEDAEFEENTENQEDNQNDTVAENQTTEDFTSEENAQTSENENENENENTEEKFTVQYELSHDDIRFALYNLVYDAYPGECLDIIQVYDNRFVMMDWDKPGVYWSQQYLHDDKGVSLVGYREQVFAEFITEAEKNALELMRTTYASMEAELNNYKLAEAHAEKVEKIQNNDEYELIKDSIEFKDLMSKMDDYSLDNLSTQADLILAKYVKSAKSFSLIENGDSTSSTVKTRIISLYSGVDEEAKSKPYGGIFDEYFKRKNAKK